MNWRCAWVPGLYIDCWVPYWFWWSSLQNASLFEQLSLSWCLAANVKYPTVAPIFNSCPDVNKRSATLQMLGHNWQIAMARSNRWPTSTLAMDSHQNMATNGYWVLGDFGSWCPQFSGVDKLLPWATRSTSRANDGSRRNSIRRLIGLITQYDVDLIYLLNSIMDGLKSWPLSLDVAPLVLPSKMDSCRNNFYRLYPPIFVCICYVELTMMKLGTPQSSLLSRWKNYKWPVDLDSMCYTARS